MKARWRMMALGLAVVGLLGSLALVASAFPDVETGPGWDETADAGHSMLITGLTGEHPVRIVENTLGVLDDGVEENSALLVFPVRPPTAVELDVIKTVLSSGGHVVIAADGHHARSWTHDLGGAFHDVPVMLPPDTDLDCIPVETPVDAAPCLPSPSAFPEFSYDDGAQGRSFLFQGVSKVPVFIDTDLDQELTPRDRGPAALPMILQWGHQAGKVTVIADGDLWRNGVLQDHDDNLQFILQSVAESATVYVDSTAGGRGLIDEAGWAVYHALTGTTWPAVMLLLVVVGGSVAALVYPRVRPFPAHKGLGAEGDLRLDEKVRAMLRAGTLEEKTRSRSMEEGP